MISLYSIPVCLEIIEAYSGIVCPSKTVILVLEIYFLSFPSIALKIVFKSIFLFKI